MNSSTTSTRIVIPKLTDEENEGLRDYWKIYEAHRQEVVAELFRMAADLPEFKFILENASLQSTVEQQQSNTERQRRAIYQGEWEPYLVSLWEQGKRYAQAGLSFHAWFELVSVLRRCMRPHLLETFGQDPKRLLAAMNGADILIEIIMSTVGESYLDTKEQLIHEQEKQIQSAIERGQVDEVFRN